MDDGRTASRETFALGDLPLGRVMDEALALTKRYGWAAAAVGVLPMLPITIGTDLAQSILEASGLRMSSFGMGWLLWMEASLIGGLLSAPLAAGMIFVFATAYLGKPVTIREGFRHALGCWPWVAPTYVVLYAFVYAGFNYMCFLPGIALMIALYLHLTIMSLEGAGPLTAISRGFTLSWGRVGAITLIVLANALIAIAANGFAHSLGPPFLGDILYPLFYAPVRLYFAAVVVVVYISARSRHEAIDLQILADDIAAEEGEETPIRL